MSNSQRRRIEPGPGQESVWDYPRPPRLEATAKRLQVYFGGQCIADTTGGYRVLETSHPPSYYIPPADVQADVLQAVSGGSFCEWKGRAAYFDLRLGEAHAPRAAWCYPNPSAAFTPIRDYLCFYASAVERCVVGGETVQAQEGDFYGGWITNDIVGPFKGGPGTMGW